MELFIHWQGADDFTFMRALAKGLKAINTNTYPEILDLAA